MQSPDRPMQAPRASYAYKASLVGSAHRFDLTDEGLAWQAGGRSGLWSYADIAAVRLSYRPISMQSRRFRADIEHCGGGRIAVLSTTWQTVTLMAPQDRDFRAFIVDLHRRMAEAGSTAVLSGGITRGAYAAAAALLVLVAVALAALLVRALATGAWSGALFLAGFAALFSWQIGGFIRRNRPRRYAFGALPKALLP